MMRTHVIASCGVVLLFAAFISGAGAHHSFGEYYLESDTIQIEGRVVEFEYKNPHTWVHIDAQDPFGRQIVLPVFMPDHGAGHLAAAGQLKHRHHRRWRHASANPEPG